MKAVFLRTSLPYAFFMKPSHVYLSPCLTPSPLPFLCIHSRCICTIDIPDADLSTGSKSIAGIYVKEKKGGFCISILLYRVPGIFFFFMVGI